MAAAVSCILFVLALACFALAMDRHYRQAFDRTPSASQRLALRVAGVVLTVFSPIPWIALQGPTMALVTWIFCGTPLAGIAVVGVFTLAAERRRAGAHSPGKRVANRPSASR